MSDDDKKLYEIAKKCLNIGSMEELALLLNYAKTTVNNWYRGGFNDTVRMKIEKAINQSSNKTIDDHQESTGITSWRLAPDLTPLNYYHDIGTAAGYGAINGDSEPEVIMFPTDMLKSMFGLTEFKDLDIINVIGDSMEPIVDNGETILVRRTPEVKNNQIAVLRVDGEIFIKRFQRDPKGKWIRLTSNNELYRVMDFEKDEMNTVEVIGVLVGKFKPY